MTRQARRTARPTARPINRPMAAADVWRRLDDTAAAAADLIVDTAAPLVLRVIEFIRAAFAAWAAELAAEIENNRRAAAPRAPRSNMPARRRRPVTVTAQVIPPQVPALPRPRVPRIHARTCSTN